jgi:2-polyprenyl-3-methyl-5-hydroxy-6-metoxy-1,4-benzoquinol methylase
MAATRTSRETNASVLRLASIRRVNHRVIGEGQIDFPCIPSMLEVYASKLAGLWDILGKPFTEAEMTNLKNLLQQQLVAGFKVSPYARVIVGYQCRPPPQGIKYIIRLNNQTMEDIYSTGWVSEEKQTPFGRLPDAKVMALAAELGEPGAAPVLDIGAGTGRNAIPLARRGHPTRAVEPVATLAGEMRKVAENEKLPLEVDQIDFLGPDPNVQPGHYKLVIVAEVVSHFRGLDQVRKLFERVSEALAPGGLMLVSSFLTADGYKPDTLAREAAGFAWSSIFTRAELKAIVDELPFDRMSDESVHDYEKEHLPAEGWPPTSWFVAWAQGTDTFDVPVGKAPIDLRWLVYRRRS